MGIPLPKHDKVHTGPMKVALYESAEPQVSNGIDSGGGKKGEEAENSLLAGKTAELHILNFSKPYRIQRNISVWFQTQEATQKAGIYATNPTNITQFNCLAELKPGLHTGRLYLYERKVCKTSETEKSTVEEIFWGEGFKDICQASELLCNSRLRWCGSYDVMHVFCRDTAPCMAGSRNLQGVQQVARRSGFQWSVNYMKITLWLFSNWHGDPLPNPQGLWRSTGAYVVLCAQKHETPCIWRDKQIEQAARLSRFKTAAGETELTKIIWLALAKKKLRQCQR